MKGKGLRASDTDMTATDLASTIARSIRRSPGSFGILIAPYIQPGILASSRNHASGGL
jgi:hypothetical protein